MRPTVPPHRRARSLVIARRANAPQPTAILGTLGMIVALMLAWAGLVL